MTEGFYDSKLFAFPMLCIYNTSMNRYDVYEVRRTLLRLFSYSPRIPLIIETATFLMPFDHYPSLEELQQLPELFI